MDGKDCTAFTAHFLTSLQSISLTDEVPGILYSAVANRFYSDMKSLKLRIAQVDGSVYHSVT